VNTPYLLEEARGKDGLPKHSISTDASAEIKLEVRK
jgi:hypothetical protein